MSTQYGEEKWILEHTRGKRGGVLVDVGAADPVVISNSHFLLAEYDWQGFLIEPLPKFARACREHYADNPRVKVIEAAAAGDPETLMYPFDYCTTSSTEWRDRVIKMHNAVYDPPIKVRGAGLGELLKEAGCPRLIDFLSVDVEGMDNLVITSMDWDYFTVDLICVELPDAALLSGLGFAHYVTTAGNQLWKRIAG